MNSREHWDAVYETKSDSELSWFQSDPQMSLSLIEMIHPPPKRFIDIGGGQSALTAALLHHLALDATVLDISQAAIERAKKRLGTLAEKVRWVVRDVLEFQEADPYDLWHDRAVYHFLTTAEQRRRYASIAAAAVGTGGHAIIATFARTGPERCSGLPVQRFDPQSLAAEFAPSFRLVASRDEKHTTPWGTPQDFNYVLLRRT